MKLNKQTPRENVRTRETLRSGFRKFAPLVAGLAFSALTLLPSVSSAQTHTCSAKRVNSPMETFSAHKMNRGKVTGLTMFVPAGKGKRIEITLPDGYVNHLASQAKAAPEKSRSTMVRSALKTTLEGALAALGTKASATFECGKAPSVPVAARSPAKSESPSAKAGPSTPAKTAGPTIRDPIPPRKKSGSGSKTDPYVIEIPVPRGTKKGTKIATSSMHVNSIRGGKTTAKVYFKLTFVTQPHSDKNYRSDPAKLSIKVATLMASTATAHIRKRDKSAEPVSAGGLNGNCLREIRGVANTKSDTVGSYLGISSEPAKRRRTLGGI